MRKSYGFCLNSTRNRKTERLGRDLTAHRLRGIGNCLTESAAVLGIHVDALVRNLCRSEMDNLVECTFSRDAKRGKIVRLPRGMAGNGCGTLPRCESATRRAIRYRLALGVVQDRPWSHATLAGCAPNSGRTKFTARVDRIIWIDLSPAFRQLPCD